MCVSEASRQTSDALDAPYLALKNWSNWPGFSPCPIKWSAKLLLRGLPPLMCERLLPGLKRVLRTGKRDFLW